MDQSADRMETSKEDTVEDQMQILDVCKENGHFSHGNTLLSEQNEDSSKILIKYHQSSEVSLQTLSTSEEVLQEVEKDCIESIDSSEAHEIAQNTTIGEPTAAENQRNPLCPKKSIPIITISLEEVTNFDMNKQELIETDETPILSTEDQLPHQEQIEDTKQKDTIVFELSNLEKKSVVVLEAIKGRNWSRSDSRSRVFTK
ncbi:unnamed protein product, partial [Mesorhabditis belari]|uniref:Uncharacterized protein n=1 Tax=Mesorhabditis belari TaxID=2138241 RepID=A0AAF3FSQ0_9BILA